MRFEKGDVVKIVSDHVSHGIPIGTVTMIDSVHYSNMSDFYEILYEDGSWTVSGDDLIAVKSRYVFEQFDVL